MAKNEFLPFATADGANVLASDEYQKLTSRSNGFSAGVARSRELNTVWRQASVIAHVVAQFIADTTNSDVVDDGDVGALKTSLVTALSEKIKDTVPAASTTVAGITRLSSDTDSDDETMAATPKAVKAAYDMAKNVSVDGMYPVGIVVWFAQNKDPNTLFPGTTWKYIGENKTVRLATADGKDVMTTGGADSVKLAVGNLPAHGHTFSATTGSFDYGSKATSSAGAHTHNVSGTAASAGAHTHTLPSQTDGGSVYGAHAGKTAASATATSSAGAHTHTVSGTAASAGAHTHTVAIGSHTHTVSGTTANTGSGSAVNITNAFIKLMGWYRSA